MKETIRIYARLKPVDGQKRSCTYETNHSGNQALDASLNEDQDSIQFTVMKEVADGFVNNSREYFKFYFDGVFLCESPQADVFETVARPIVDRALEGYNGTLFAYGQTGSGKTYAITGAVSNSASDIHKGIIPRTLSYIFEHLDERQTTNSEQLRDSAPAENSVCISYFEIYNENGYDLLQPREDFNRLEDLSKIALLEDVDQNIHLRNLSVHRAQSEEEAMSLLSIGEMNRAMADTPMNQTSTRSHCIFTIILTRREASSAVVRTSKLHIVDLAGSERVHKSGIAGRTLTESKYINLALHHLEQVIIALADKNRTHIPYRNSMMTSILKDSLGGNSLTSMIATCSLEEINLGETISTCRFAQRVALIKNEVVRNEELNPLVQIELLKKQVQDLKTSYALLAGSEEALSEQLTQEEINKCSAIVEDFVSNTELPELNLPNIDIRKIHLCFRLLRSLAVRARSASDCTDIKKASPNSDFKMREMQNKLDEMRKTLKQRDKEMTVLCRLLKQEKRRIDSLLKCQAQFLEDGHLNSTSESHSIVEALDQEKQPRATGLLLDSSVNSKDINPRTSLSDEVIPHFSKVTTPSNFPLTEAGIKSRFIPAVDSTVSQNKTPLYPTAVMATVNPSFSTDCLPSLDKVPRMNDLQLMDLRRALLTKFVEKHSERGRIEELKQSMTGRLQQARVLAVQIRTLQGDIQNGNDQLQGLIATRGLNADVLLMQQNIAIQKMHLQTMLNQLRTLKEQVDFYEQSIKQISSVLQLQFDQWWQHTISRQGILPGV